MQIDYETFILPSHASVIVGGQFGSEAKGLVAAFIAGVINDAYKGAPEEERPHFYSTTNAGAQAGHTTIMPDMTKFVCYHLPTTGVLVEHAHIHLNAGAIIDLDLLKHEVYNVSLALGRTPESIWSRMSVHPNATVITNEAKLIEAEGATAHLGSTQKGVGAALADKIMRKPNAIISANFAQDSVLLPNLGVPNFYNRTGMIEIPQGTSLSLNSSGFYPKTTSRECWVTQGLMDAALHPSALGIVNMVVRTFPIRVGHIYRDETIVGHSGPFYSDGDEINWADLPGIMPERTTVTQRIRRIARWSRKQYRHALRLNRPDNVFLTFTNYCTSDELKQIVLWMREDEHEMNLRQINHFFSWGPRTDQVSNLYVQAVGYCRQE